MKKIKNGEKPFTLVIEDPLDNCFIYSRFYPNPDPQITCEYFERTNEQNDELGITDLVKEETN